jgi:hypothetical protein
MVSDSVSEQSEQASKHQQNSVAPKFAGVHTQSRQGGMNGGEQNGEGEEATGAGQFHAAHGRAIGRNGKGERERIHRNAVGGLGRAVVATPERLVAGIAAAVCAAAEQNGESDDIATSGDRQCAQRGRKLEAITITDGGNPDGTLRIVTFCGERCRDAWKAAHPFDPTARVF